MQIRQRRYVEDPYLELERYGKEIIEDPKFRRLLFFRQHGSSSTYRHCIAVALKSLSFAKERHIKVDVPALVHAALLHDYYLYDWHESKGSRPPHHASMHPIYAANNAKRDFNLDEKELADIMTHMWPIAPLRYPRSREGWIIVYADKCVAINEFLMLPQKVEKMAPSSAS